MAAPGAPLPPKAPKNERSVPLCGQIGLGRHMICWEASIRNATIGACIGDPFCEYAQMMLRPDNQH
eukprot:4692286-Prymnesium_polylepis.1